MKFILKRLSKSSILTLLGGNAAASFLGLLTFALLGRNLEASAFGIWVLFTTATSMADLILKGIVKSAYIWAISTTEPSQASKVHGAAWLLTITISIALAVIIWLIGINFQQLIAGVNLQLFFAYYPIYVLLGIPLNFITWRLQGERNFGPCQSGRLLVNVFFIGAILAGTWAGVSIKDIVICYALIQGLTSIVFLAWFPQNLLIIGTTSLQNIKTMWRFGRNSLATLAGGSLLRGTDIYFIGGWIGPEAVAIYGIPMKLIDILDIPLRSIAIAKFSALASSWKNNSVKFYKVLYETISLGFIVAISVVLGILAASELVLNFFSIADIETGKNLLFIFSCAMLIMPFEKFLGVSFDAIGRPDRNALKVWVMLLANIVGDLLALYFFQSIYLVAVVTIVNQLLGVIYSTRFFEISITDFSHLGKVTFKKLKKAVISIRPRHQIT